MFHRTKATRLPGTKLRQVWGCHSLQSTVLLCFLLDLYSISAEPWIQDIADGVEDRTDRTCGDLNKVDILRIAERLGEAEFVACRASEERRGSTRCRRGQREPC